MAVNLSIKEIIELVDSLISNLDPTPINVNNDFPLRWESNHHRWIKW